MQLHSSAKTLNATLNYIFPENIEAFDLRSDAKSADVLVSKVDARSMNINNARVLKTPPTLNTMGFELADNTYKVTDYFDDNILKEQLYPQVIKHLKSQTGAVSGLIFDHTIRSVEDSLTRSEKRSPVKTIHNDYTPASAEHRLNVELKKYGISANSFSHYQFINTWIPLVDLVVDSPLAFLDIKTVSDQESNLMPVIYPNRTGEIEVFSHSEKHQWYFYPKMTAKEQLIFKVFDSNSNSLVSRVPHTGFTISNADPAKAKRISIEVRSIMLFE